MHVVTGHVTIL